MIKRILGADARYRLRLLERAARALIDRPLWVKAPPVVANAKVCLLACFSADGSLSRHTIDLSHAWSREGFVVIVIVACDRREHFAIDADDSDHLGGILLRRNLGYDFGSWSVCIRAMRDIRSASLLALANDSVYGPLDGFHEALERVEASGADIVGMTDSFEESHHLQSYLVFYKPPALQSAAFDRFWRKRRSGNRDEIIRDDELPFLRTMRTAQLTVEVLFPTPAQSAGNPTLSRWRELLEAGFPFVKVQLLRDDPCRTDLVDWDHELARRGYDPTNVMIALGSGFPSSAAGKTLTGAAPPIASPTATGRPPASPTSPHG